MADNIQLNTNSTIGSTIRTDDLSGAHVQYVKLMDGTDGGTTVIPGGSTGLSVNLTSIGALDGNLDVDVVDRAARDCGKIDIAAFDVGLPAGTNWVGYVGLATTSTLPAGTNAIGKLAANSGVDIGDVDILSIAAGDNNIGNVDLASAIPAGTNSIGYVSLNSAGSLAVNDNSGSITVDAPVATPVFVTPTPSTSGGWSPRFVPNLKASSIGIVKDAAGTLGGWYIYNPNGTEGYVQFFNTNVVAPGTTVPLMAIGIPSTGAANLELTNGIQFTSVIRVAATTASSNGTGVTTGLECSFFFK